MGRKPKRESWLMRYLPPYAGVAALVALVVAVMFTGGPGPSPAPASTAALASAPAGAWVSQDDSCGTAFLGVSYPCYMWFQPSSRTWRAEDDGRYTALRPGPCKGNWCERVLPDGQCMSYYPAAGVLGEAACDMAPDELWEIARPQGGTWTWASAYLQHDRCPDGAGQKLAEHGVNSQLRMRCDETYGYTGTNQQWDLDTGA